MRPALAVLRSASRRLFSTTRPQCELRDIAGLHDRILPSFQQTAHNDLLALQWPSPPRNVLVVRKDGSKRVDEAVQELVGHIQSTYENVNIIFEPHVAGNIHELLRAPVYTFFPNQNQSMPPTLLGEKVDLVATLGGDGTILHAASLFATATRVPPVLSFSMGTLGFLGEWKFAEYKKAFREVYMSGAGAGNLSSVLEPEEQQITSGGGEDRPESHKLDRLSGWSSIRGKSMGKARGARVLLRNRLKIGIFDADGKRLPHEEIPAHGTIGRHDGDVYAMNEVLLHRGRAPHLSQIQIHVGGRFLTEAVADGMLISTPTGSTAYSLSSGGSIVHPLVSSLLLTPICPRSLSFRPLVLPANTPISLRVSSKNRADEIEVSVDGLRRSKGLQRGMEVRVVGEDIKADEQWNGGLPSIVRASGSGSYEGEDHWVGGLNSLLKFNHAFGEDVG